MSALALVAHQFRYDQKAFWRNPAAVFFTVMFPVVVFLILAIVFGDDTVDVDGGIEATTYYVPAIMALAVISATMQTLAMTLVIAREDGRLKRGRGTPMPAWVFIAGRIGNSIVVALMMLALLAAIGGLLYGGPVPLGAAAGAAADAGDRRRLLLLPRHRPDRGDPLPGRGGGDRQRAAAAALLPLRHLHPRRRAARRRHRLRRPSSRSATSSRPSSTSTSPAPAAPARLGRPGRGRALGRRRPRARDPLLPLDPARRLRKGQNDFPGGPSIASRRQCCTTSFWRSPTSSAAAAFYDSMLAPLGWRRHFEEDKTIGWGIAKPVFFIAAHHEPQPGFGLLSFSALGIVAVKAAWEGGLRAGGDQRQRARASAARTGPAPTRPSSRTRTGTRSRSPSGPTSSPTP